MNYIAILCSAIAAMIIGALWYGPLFGKLWKKYLGFTKKDMDKAKEQGMAASYGLMFISSLVTAYVLATLLESLTLKAGMSLTLLLWLGFYATTQLSPVLWEHKPWGLYGVNALHYLVSLVVMAGILGIWV